MKYSVAISGSYNGGRVEDLFKDLSMDGILHMALIGREVSLQVSSENLEEVKKRLCSLGIKNITVLEWRQSGITVSEPGAGTDPKNTIKVSLIPSVKGGGITQLALLSEYELPEDMQQKVSKKVEEILDDAGITDALYTVHMMEKTEGEEYLAAASVATLNALFDSGGVITLE